MQPQTYSDELQMPDWFHDLYCLASDVVLAEDLGEADRTRLQLHREIRLAIERQGIADYLATVTFWGEAEYFPPEVDWRELFWPRLEHLESGNGATVQTFRRSGK